MTAPAHPHRPRRLPAGVALLAILALAAPAPAPAAATAFGPCERGAALQCATLAVPLDRSGRLPGEVGLFAERRPAGRPSGLAPVLVLAGGPGQSATAMTPDWL